MRTLAALLLALAASAVLAQTNVRVRGTIDQLQGDVLTVKSRDGRTIQLNLAPDAQVVTAKAATLAEFKPGSYVGVTSVKGPEGRLVARRVHALGPQVPSGHTAWDSIPDSLMTNANVTGTARLRAGQPRRPQAGRNHLHQRAQRRRQARQRRQTHARREPRRAAHPGRP